MTDQKQPNDLLGGIKHLIEQYKELNTILLQDGPKIVTRLISNPDKANTLQRINKDIISPLTTEWLNLSRQHIENLVDLGKTASRRFQQVLDTAADTPAQPANRAEILPATPPPDASPRAEILLRGPAGATATASFNLNSSKQEAQIGQFACTPFYNQNTGTSPDFTPVFHPMQFSVSPGIATPVQISVVIPESLEPAVFRSTVVVLGFDNTTFDVVLSVDEPSE